MGLIKNKKMSKDHRKKISMALKGKRNALGSIRTEAFKKNITDYWTKHTHPRWKGDNAGYVSKHMRIYRWFGKASKCENKNCLHKSKVYDWANKSKKYLSKRNDWLMLCRSCHKKYDMTDEAIKKNSQLRKIWWKKHPEIKSKYSLMAKKQYKTRKKNKLGQFI